MSPIRPLLLVSDADIQNAACSAEPATPLHFCLSRFFNETVMIGEQLVVTKRHGQWILSLPAVRKLECWRNRRVMRAFAFTLYPTDNARLPPEWQERQAQT